MKKNNDIFSEVIVGLFMTAVLALLVYFTIVISGIDILVGREKTLVTIEFHDVGGLKERDNVVYRGMKVGVVEHIALAPSNVTVTVKIDRDVVLREKCRATVAALSFLGGNYLLLEEGTGEPCDLATSTFHGDPPADWMRDLGDIARKLNESADMNRLKSIVSNIEETAANVNLIVARVERGEGTVGKFLSTNDTVYADIEKSVAEAKDVVAGAKRTVERAESAFDNAAKARSGASRRRTKPCGPTSRTRSRTFVPRPRSSSRARVCSDAPSTTRSSRTTPHSSSRT